MTPSQWHDDVRNRDAGHDEMQIAVFDYLRDVRDEDHPGLPRGVYFEMPFRVRGQIIAWGDVVEVWSLHPDLPIETKQQAKWDRKFTVWEIKPKIYSIGAVVRQCIALEDAVKAATADWRRPEIQIIPVVRSDDPKLAGLRHVFCAAAWDGERLS